MIAKGMVAALFALVCTTSTAHRHVRPLRSHGVHVVMRPHYAARPAVTVRINNRITQKERLGMAMAYIRKNGAISPKEYAKITGLQKKTAEAELESFAADKRKPIVATARNGKTVYKARA